MIERKPIALIVNPNSGRKTGRMTATIAARCLEDSGLTVKIMESTEPGQIGNIAQTLNQGEWDGIISVGGDGTLFEMINGIYKTGSGIHVTLGQIPAGTGNSFLRDMDIYSLEDAMDAIITNNTRSVDMALFSCAEGDYQFVNMLGAGFVTNVAKRAERYKLFGSKSYIFGVLEEVIRLDPVPVRLEIDGQVIERNAIFLELCNSRYTGGAMLMAPSAQIDDGMLDVIVMNACSRRRILKLLPTIFTGKHIDEPELEVFQGKNIVLESKRPMILNVDGEVFGSTPINVGIKNKELQIFSGKK